MPIEIPSQRVIDEFMSPSTKHTRRVEIYEEDGITRWNKDTELRLKSGSVSIEYGRPERRSIDLVLSNDDRKLINAPGGLWYDKIIKVFRGVEMDAEKPEPRILILTDKTNESLVKSFRDSVSPYGFGDITYNKEILTYDETIGYDIIMSLGPTTTSKIDILKQAYQSGRSVFVQNEGAAGFIEALYPGIVGTTISSTATVVTPEPSRAIPIARGWNQFTLNRWSTEGSSWSIYQPQGVGWAVAAYSADDPSKALVSSFSGSSGGKAVVLSLMVDYQQYTDFDFNNLIKSSLRWLDPTEALTNWETQIGEFMIDRISEQHFPHDVMITGRDYAKKCLSSKFAFATQFDKGLTLESLISAIAGSAGITKRSIPATGVTVNRTFHFERGTTRWDAMEEIATAYNYEIFFDGTGYLVIRPFQDPVLTEPSIIIKTGKDGQLASYEKSTSDIRLYNHIVVTGESSDSTIAPVSAEKKNENPNSPTRISAIGDRLYEYVSAFITTQEQAENTAAKFLSVHSLEEFELSFESLMLPWLEVGEILGWEDPNPAPDDPDTFLLDSLTIPLELGPMSGTAKRVIKVA